MTSRLNPYINFNGNTREAMEFYGEVFGAKPTFSTFGDFGDPSAPGADKIMHAMIDTPAGYTLMASDTPPGSPYTPGSAITISLSGDDDAELRGYWDQLADGGAVMMPLEKQMWGDVFGMLTDRFGIAWMVNIMEPQQS